MAVGIAVGKLVAFLSGMDEANQRLFCQIIIHISHVQLETEAHDVGLGRRRLPVIEDIVGRQSLPSSGY